MTEKPQEILEDIKRVLKVGKLDTALLFLASSLGIIFGFLQIIVGGYHAMLYFIPIWILGWFFPFYIGFIEGGILYDSPLDRVRGWIYLFVGCGVYVVTLTNTFLVTLFPQYITIRLIGVVLIFLMSYLVESHKLTEKIFAICKQKTSRIVWMSVIKCESGAIYFAMGSFILVQMQKVELVYDKVLPILTVLSFSTLFFYSWYLSEIKSRYYSRRIYQKFTIEKKEGNSRLMRLSKKLGLLSFIIFFILISLQEISPQFIGIFLFRILAAVSGIMTISSIIAYSIYKPSERIIFQE